MLGRRGLDLAGLPVKQLSFNMQNESPMMRKPFSPISSTDSSRSNATNILGDLNRKHDTFQKTLTNNNVITPLFTTPSKMISTTDLENRTPQSLAIPVPSTPATASIPMQMAITPMHKAITTPASMQMAIVPATKLVSEEIEYSFEERRAGFVLPLLC